MPREISRVKAARFTRLIIENRYLDIWTSGGRWHPTPVGFPSTTTILGDEWRVAYHSHLYAKRNANAPEKVDGPSREAGAVGEPGATRPHA